MTEFGILLGGYITWLHASLFWKWISMHHDHELSSLISWELNQKEKVWIIIHSNTSNTFSLLIWWESILRIYFYFYFCFSFVCPYIHDNCGLMWQFIVIFTLFLACSYKKSHYLQINKCSNLRKQKSSWDSSHSP